MFNINKLKKYGLSSFDNSVQGVFNSRSGKGVDDLLYAVDSALQTTPNIAVPSIMTAYIDTEVTSVLFTPRNATEVFSEVKKGDWTAPYAMFRVSESTGSIAPYGDYSGNGRSGSNYNYPTREQSLFQTIISYGDFEQELASEAKINLISEKQMAAAETVSIASNYMYLYGVDGREIYGLLNDPNKYPAIVAKVGKNGSAKWENKITTEIFDDIKICFTQLVKQNPNIRPDLDLKLVVSPSQHVALISSTEFNVSVLDMLSKAYPKMSIITLPELEATETMDGSFFITLQSIRGQKVGEMAFGEKYKAGRIIPDKSSFEQKVSFSSYGTIIRHYSCISTMIGVS